MLNCCASVQLVTCVVCVQQPSSVCVCGCVCALCSSVCVCGCVLCVVLALVFFFFWNPIGYSDLVGFDPNRSQPDQVVKFLSDHVSIPTRSDLNLKFIGSGQVGSGKMPTPRINTMNDQEYFRRRTRMVGRV